VHGARRTGSTLGEAEDELALNRRSFPSSFVVLSAISRAPSRLVIEWRRRESNPRNIQSDSSISPSFR
jgi:hypothetical protein